MIAPVRLRLDGKAYSAIGNLYAAAGHRAPVAVRRAVRRKGEKARGIMAKVVRDLLKIRLRDIRAHVKGKMVATNSYAVIARGKIPLERFRTQQTSGGVQVRDIDQNWIEGRAKLATAFQGKTGKPSNQPGNAGKRRGSLGGRIVYGVGKRRRQGFRSVGGVMVPSAFVDQKAQAEFNKVAAELPAELMHQLWVVTEGLDIKANRARFARLSLGRRGSDDHGG
ncbi:MAG: hypothetical protein GY873_30185 [Bosea sp.]|uniref:hypothetical protein n=1 Tax=Bosea sp. (in: a-proteobacteria) TaxID=1871050 RepID=UPI0023968869|nr:hypothetical protein [Bosea sp. (in: a-proteobacteria)]MCP4738465.1 hypothetical protein [Bosea sp. (in: a-proteobacteria)]